MSSASGIGRLAGKTIVVTGAAHGIGRAHAQRFAREGLISSSVIWTARLSTR